VPVEVVGVAACGVGLPDLNQATPHKVAVAVRDTPVTMILSPKGSPSCWRVRSWASSPTGPRAYAGPVVSERVFGRMMSGAFGALSRVET
jgi:hypothetical protein